MEVRERIRIDGKPIAYDRFAKYFNTVYDRLDANKDEFGGEMPAYFRFLTLMAFHTFLQEKVTAFRSNKQGEKLTGNL